MDHLYTLFDGFTDLPTPKDDQVLRVYTKVSTDLPTPLFLCVCLHGVNHSAHSFQALIGSLSAYSLPFLYLAYDLRGHGASSGFDLHKDTMSMAAHVPDLEMVLSFAREKYAAVADPRVLLIGHSLGAAIACKYAAGEHGKQSLLGLVLLDFCEGPALATVQSTYAHLQGIPPSFPSMEAAVAWSVASGRVENGEAAAQLTLPYVLHPQPPHSQELHWVAQPFMSAITVEILQEWYRGTSQAFVSLSPLPRMLMVASVATLADRELTVQHMQGKFKVCVVGGCHAFHEDKPKECAAEIAAFAQRILAT